LVDPPKNTPAPEVPPPAPVAVPLSASVVSPAVSPAWTETDLSGPEPARGETGLGTQVKEAFGLIAGFGALCYVFGFLCINSYLRSHGVLTFSAVGTEYIAAGLCFAGFYVVAGIIVQITPLQKTPSQIWQTMHENLNDDLARELGKFQQKMELSGSPASTIRMATWSFRISFALTYGLIYIAKAVLSVLRAEFWDCVLVFLVVTLACYLPNHDFRALRTREFYEWIILVPLGISLLVDFAQQTAAWKWRLLPFVLVTLLLSAECYGLGLYPYISASIGGGTPVPVSFILDPANKAGVESALGIKIPADITPQLELLIETSDSLIVTPNGQPGHIVQFKKDQVKAIVYGNR
jgi:hypothetical protein